MPEALTPLQCHDACSRRKLTRLLPSNPILCSLTLLLRLARDGSELVSALPDDTVCCLGLSLSARMSPVGRCATSFPRASALFLTDARVPTGQGTLAACDAGRAGVPLPAGALGSEGATSVEGEEDRRWLVFVQKLGVRDWRHGANHCGNNNKVTEPPAPSDARCAGVEVCAHVVSGESRQV